MSDTHTTTKTKEMYPYTVFSEALIQSTLETDSALNKELLESAAVVRPVVYNLSDSLHQYTKNHLQELAEDYGLDIARSTVKQKLVELLRTEMIKRFEKMLPYFPISNLEFLSRFNVETPSLELEERDLAFKDISHIHNFGVLFLYRKDTTYTAVVPTELLPSLQELQKPMLWKEATLYQRMGAYAVALSNLYGAVDIDQYAIIWNRYEEEMLTPIMVQDVLEVLSDVQYYWWFFDEHIVSSFFSRIEDLDQFLTKVRDVAYYEPTREELVALYQTPYDENSPAMSAMMEFLSGYRLDDGGHIEDLMDEISDSCIVGNGMQDAFNVLNEYGLLFNGMDEINRFTELYTQMNENIRKWELRGHTPKAFKNSRH
ncbi:MAG: hypothetical protein ACOX0W_02980 [Sphaerochaetaceae bacterium]